MEDGVLRYLEKKKRKKVENIKIFKNEIKQKHSNDSYSTTKNIWNLSEEKKKNKHK